jgi:hypothetical protein
MGKYDHFYKLLKKESNILFEGSHSIYTPKEIIEDGLNNLSLDNKTVLVLYNVEFVIVLIDKFNADPNNITFVSDNDTKTNLINRFGVRVKTDTKDMNKKSFDYVVLNPPFGMFKEFKNLAQDLAKEKALIISGTRDYHNGNAFENVEYYKYLGECFPTAKITASLAIIDPNGTDSLTVVDSNNVSHKVAANPKVAPGDDIDIWSFATDVLDQKLSGYDNAKKGKIDRMSSIIESDGIPVIYSAGKKGEEFTKDNQAPDTEKLVKENTKYCWATVSHTQKDIIGGLGYHKVVVTHAANEPGHLGNPKYAGPDWGCGSNCWYIECDSKQDAEKCINYLNHPDVVKLVKGLKSSVLSNSKAVWKKIPHHSKASSWIENYAD